MGSSLPALEGFALVAAAGLGLEGLELSLSSFCMRRFSSLILRRRSAGTNSSHLFVLSVSYDVFL